MCLLKYPSKFAAKFRQKYRWLCNRLCSQLHRSLYLDLNLDLDLDLNPSLYGWLFKQLFETLFQMLFAKLFGSMFKSKSAWLWASSRLALCRQMLLPRRPVGRGVDGRIVAGRRSATTCRCPPGLWTAVAELLLFPENAVLQSASCRTDRAYARNRLPVKALAPELRSSLRHSLPLSIWDSTPRSRRHSARN